jgi:hypothetical protein
MQILMVMGKKSKPTQQELDFKAEQMRIHRDNFMCNPADNDYKCPFLRDDDIGGSYVDDDYCKSFAKGRGCKFIRVCRTRSQHKIMKGEK